MNDLPKSGVIAAVVCLVFAIVCSGWLLHKTHKKDEQIKQQVHELEEKAEKEKEEVLKRGKEVDALVIDKSKNTYSSGDSVSVMPVVVGGAVYSIPTTSPGIESTNYYLKIYADDKNYNISVPLTLYDEKQVGSRLKIKLYKDKIEIL
ncbi:hypothetical protein [Bacillus haynesii]|uniref:hypothetical protein n=1 Tax=Bacillus haynesii TaxID=1925021 RepID=UPI0035D99496